MAQNWWWGRSASIDLHGCNQELITSPKAIERFVKELAAHLGMKRVGPTEIKRFGHGQLRGYSVMQFIETSTITAHFDEKGQRAFIDVFSCRQYSPKPIARFCRRYFQANNSRLYVEERK
jgi:S-adenosylmethionine/arginine decarboxylase-like enzyme